MYNLNKILWVSAVAGLTVAGSMPTATPALAADYYKGKTISAVVLRDQQETPLDISIDKDGKLGVALGRLSIDNLEKLGYYKISKQEFSFMESIPVGIIK